MCGLAMHVWPSDGQNSQICTTFPVVKCVFLKSPCQMRTTPFSGSPIHTAAVHFYVSLACAGVYTEAQCCFKSLALRSCQCGRKTRYGLEFWSLDLPSAPVNFQGRVPALLITHGYNLHYMDQVVNGLIIALGHVTYFEVYVM